MPLPNLGRLLSVNLAVLRRDRAGDHASGMTGIDKRPTEHRVELRDNQVIGDTVVDTRHHGGYDQAVYAYASEDAAWWSNELGRPVPPGSFGENLTTDALDVTGAV